MKKTGATRRILFVKFPLVQSSHYVANFFVYLQSLYATDRLFQPPSLNDGLLLSKIIIVFQ